MLEELACTCEAPDCDRALDEEEWVLTFRTDGGERRAYECACGHVTVTVSR
jgi:hypothetical protein